ncbi:MAG: ABC transporter substrate-binding protein [Nocardioides sp.]
MAATLALGLSFALAACGSSGSDDTSATSTESSGSSGSSTTVTVGVIPIVDVAPIYLGIKQGFFSDEGLQVKMQTAQGGADIVPAVVSGKYQFGFSNTTSLILAASQNISLKVVTAGVNAGDTDGKDFGAVIVAKGSSITRPKDLEGKKVAVNTLNNINTTTVNEMVRKDGGDPSTIKYVELGFPDIIAAVKSGDVDAGQVVEPFLTTALDAGDSQIGSNYVATAKNLAVAEYFTSSDYAEKNPEVVTEFTDAMNKSLTYAAAHSDEVRSVLSSYTDIDASVQKNLILPNWTTTLNTDSIQTLADLAKEDGLISSVPDLSSLLP